ncbi:MAG TPA: hypothetical protein VKB31_09925, partial [Trueperaceae bacterium]|nr:hypothetical protein [Trueperaceae bacterium]
MLVDGLTPLVEHLRVDVGRGFERTHGFRFVFQFAPIFGVLLKCDGPTKVGPLEPRERVAEALRLLFTSLVE